jgi:poly(3-hydroxybutyrate) depolymerase
MDAYLPSAPAKPAPALVMAFGGGFTAGSQADDVARFSVGYRLAEDGPAPVDDPVLGASEIPLIAGVNEARAKAGLPPVTPRGMAQIVEAAIDDVAGAGRAVESRAAKFGVDPNHVVFGGGSAGRRVGGSAGRRVGGWRLRAVFRLWQAGSVCRRHRSLVIHSGG